MEKQSESVRDRLLARLPQPENIAAYREETASLLAKHEKALFWEEWTPRVLNLCAVGLYLFANSSGSLKSFGATEVQLMDVMAGILFFMGMIHTLSFNIYQSKVDLLKELKQVQLQVLEIQASLRKGGGLPH